MLNFHVKGHAGHLALEMEKALRLLHMFVRFGDAQGQVGACETLMDVLRGSEDLRAAVLNGGALPSLVVMLQADRPEAWRAAAELLAELALGEDEQRGAVLRSGAISQLLHLLRQSSDPAFLREGARVLARVSEEPAAAAALLREGAPRALMHLCRSDALQAHALSVHALGRLALVDCNLLRSPQVLRVLCRVAGSSVLEARLAATHELIGLLARPTNRPHLLRAHVVAVLLQCAESMNDELKGKALRSIALLLQAEFVPTAAEKLALATADMQAAAAAAATCAVQTRDELAVQQGAVVLLRLAVDSALAVRIAALSLLETLCSHAVMHAPIEEARGVQLLVALCGADTPRSDVASSSMDLISCRAHPPEPFEGGGGGGPLRTLLSRSVGTHVGVTRGSSAQASALETPPPGEPATLRTHILELVSRCLGDLMVSSSAQVSFVNARGVSALVRLVPVSPTNEVLKGSTCGGGPGGHTSVVDTEVARVLMQLAASKLHRPVLYAEGAVECLSWLMVHSEHEATLRFTTAAVGHLAALPEAQMALAEAGAIPNLARLARAHDAETQRHAARAIGNLAANASCQNEIGQCGGLRPLVKCGYSRNIELQQLVARAMVNLALEPELNRMIVAEGGTQLLVNLARSRNHEVAHWARVAQGNVEAAATLGPLVRYCPQDSAIEPVDMVTMSSLVSLLRSREEHVSVAVKRLTACAIANLLVSAHNQRLLLECNGIKPLVGLALESPEAELASQCMRALANLAVSADYRPSMLQARALPLMVRTLREAQLQGGGSHTYAVLCHAARGIANLCEGGDVAPAMQLKAADEGAVAVLLPLLTKEFEEAEDVHRAGVGDQLSSSVDSLLRETVRALAKLAQLRSNQLPMVEAEQIHLVVRLMQPGSDASVGLKTECLELLNNLADLPQTLSILEHDGIIRPLVGLIVLPDAAVEAQAAELLAKLAQVKEYQLQISREGTLPTLVELLHSSSAAAQLAGLHALIELLMDHLDNQMIAMQAGVIEPAVRLARSEDRELNGAAATLLCTLVLSEAEGGHAALRLQPESKLHVLAAMAMSSNDDAHSVAAMGLATLCNAPGASPALMTRVALPALIRLARSTKADTQCAALDALSTLSGSPQVQLDLVRMGALKVLLERAATAGADNSDIRALALACLQNVASNGSNMAQLEGAEVATRLKGLKAHMRDDVVVGRAVDAILRSISTISTLLELQGKQRLLRFGEVVAMLDCVGVAGVEAPISREVAHTCAAIGTERTNLALFVQEGGFELLNSLARSRSVAVQAEAGSALAAFSRQPDAHRAMAAQGCLVSLSALARSNTPELQLYAVSAFAALADAQAPKTPIVQSGALPALLALARNGSPEVLYLAAKALLFVR